MQTTKEWRNFVKDLKKEWKTLWRDRIDDKVRAEGISNQDYTLLSVDRGTVIIATRDYKPLDFVEILERHKTPGVLNSVHFNPHVGGWGKFIRNVLNKQKRFTKWKKSAPSESKKTAQQLKKGGRGWLHVKG